MKRVIALLSLIAAGVLLLLYGVVIIVAAARNDRNEPGFEPIFDTAFLFYLGWASLVLAGIFVLGGYLLWRRRN
ncbi:MAG: hypothetical protein IH959_03325 [Chloroflexi bacterium]|nr:hypothetical protein [Chloroflexota bacterium]